MSGEKISNNQSVTYLFLPTRTMDYGSIPDNNLSNFPISFLSIHEAFASESRATLGQVTTVPMSVHDSLMRKHESRFTSYRGTPWNSVEHRGTVLAIVR